MLFFLGQLGQGKGKIKVCDCLRTSAVKKKISGAHRACLTLTIKEKLGSIRYALAGVPACCLA